MQRESVESSNIKSIGYSYGAKILEIEFLNKMVYQYSFVPLEVYEGLMNAESHGGYFDRVI